MTAMCSTSAACVEAMAIADGACDCDGNVLDECGVCGGSGIPAGDCDCDGNQLDALGVCGGDCAADADADGICDDVDDCVGACLTLAASATVLARFTSADVLTSLPATATAMAINSTLWACVVVAALPMPTATVCVTMQKFLVAQTMQLATTTLHATEEDGSCDFCSCARANGLHFDGASRSCSGNCRPGTTYRFYVDMQDANRPHERGVWQRPSPACS